MSEQTTVEGYIREQRESQHFFYSRVSTREQSQLRQVVPDSVPPANVVAEVASGRDFKRPLYRELADNTLKHGDTLFVWSIDRFSRNLVECLHEVKELKAKGIRLVFIDDGQEVDPGEDNPAKDLFFAQLTLFAEYTRKMMLRQQRQAIDKILEEDAGKAKDDPTRRFKGRQSVIKDEVKQKCIALYKGGFTIAVIAKDVKLDRGTVRKILRNDGCYIERNANK